MNPEAIFEHVMELAVLPYFPAEPAARMAIARLIGGMADNESQVEWLTRVMTSGIFEKWEGPRELRAVFCQKFKPRDGIECTSIVYPDGLTREQLNPGRKIELPAPTTFLLGPGESVSADSELAEAVEKLVPATNLNTIIHSRTLRASMVRSDETEYAALIRAVAEYVPPDPLAGIRVPTDAEIEILKSEQNRNRKESSNVQ